MRGFGYMDFPSVPLVWCAIHSAAIDLIGGFLRKKKPLHPRGLVLELSVSLVIPVIHSAPILCDN